MSRRGQSQRRRYRKTSDRRVWVFSELRVDLRPEQIARIITAAGLEQARMEAEAEADAARTQVASRGKDGGNRHGDDEDRNAAEGVPPRRGEVSDA